MRGIVRSTVVAALTAAVLGCATTAPVPGRVLQSDDGLSEITIPPGWHERPDFGRSASLRVADSAREIYLLVNSYRPGDVDPMPLDEFARRLAGKIADGLSDARLSAARAGTINGQAAIEHEISGRLGDTGLAYLTTVVEGRHARHHLIAWTDAAGYAGKRRDLRAVAASFRESKTWRPDTPRTDLAFKWPQRLSATVTFHNAQDKRGETFALRGQAVTTVRPAGDGRLVVSSRVTSRRLSAGREDRNQAEYLQQVLREALTDLPDYAVATDGSFLGVENLAAYRQRIETALLKGLPEGGAAGRERARQIIDTALSEAALAASMQDEWNNVVGNWNGSSFVPGRDYAYRLAYQSPALGPQTFPMEITQQLQGYTPCRAGAAERSCVRLTQTTRVAGPAFTAATDRYVRATVGGGVRIDRMEVVKTVELVTEPGTLLPHKVHAREEKTVVVSADGSTHTTREVREASSTYRYSR